MSGAVEVAFQQQVEKALSSSRDHRLQRLSKANPVPARIEVSTYVFARNPDVVAEVLYQAKGVCQACGDPAPFARRSDGLPYLEVHHRKPLSVGGLDTVENAIAMCPNCHREAHFA